jgi:hypothetical protein
MLPQTDPLPTPKFIGVFPQFKGTIAGNAISFPRHSGTKLLRQQIF